MQNQDFAFGYAHHLRKAHEIQRAVSACPIWFGSSMSSQTLKKNGPEDSSLLAEHKINACANSFRVGLCTKKLETLLGDGHFHNPRARATHASSEGAVMHMSKSFFPNARRSSIGCSSSNSRPSSFKFGSSMNFNVLQSGLPER